MSKFNDDPFRPPSLRSEGGRSFSQGYNDPSGTLAAAGCGGILFIIVLVNVLRALVIMFAWNVGVDAVAKVNDIGFWPSLALSLALGILATVFKRGSSA